MCDFDQNSDQSVQSVERQKSYAILNDRLETFDRYCIYKKTKTRRQCRCSDSTKGDQAPQKKI
jgi:hypothetical protein